MKFIKLSYNEAMNYPNMRSYYQNIITLEMQIRPQIMKKFFSGGLIARENIWFPIAYKTKLWQLCHTEVNDEN